MIIKSFEINKKKLDKKFFLFYGKNKGFIEETIQKSIKPFVTGNVFIYEENDILENPLNFQNSIYNTSFFDNEKLIIIKKVSDKIYEIISQIILKNLSEITLILITETLEKKSKLRIFFEKNTETFCVPFYEDSDKTLEIIANNFIQKKKIALSQKNLNFIIERSRGDRGNLINELDKIELLSKTRKVINFDDILKLSNLAENYDFSDLIDASLLKNRKKLIKVLNENNFAGEDCILILRILLSKLKRLLKIKLISEKNNNLDEIINNFKPPIFWKEKEVLKQQIEIWTLKNLKNLINDINNIEYLIKINPEIAVISTTNFVLDVAA